MDLQPPELDTPPPRTWFYQYWADMALNSTFCMLFLANIVVCIYAKTWNSFQASVIFFFLMVTDIDRIIGCTWRMHTKGQISQTSFASRFGTDLPLYCFTIIVITLWMQWHYLYKIMENFEEALKLLEKKTHFKALLIIFILLLILQGIDARFILHDTEDWEDNLYHGWAAGLSLTLAFIGLICAISYGLLYYWYLALMKREQPDLDSMKCQVHVFFIFMVFIVLARVVVHCMTTYMVYNRQKNTDKTQVTQGAFFYFNGIIECLLNLLILYYRIKTQMNTEV
jgi:hypothetical protein